MNYYVEQEKVLFSSSKVELSLDSSSSKNQCMVFAHLHSAIEILIIRKGSFKIELDNEVAVVNEGDIVLIRSNTIHQIFSLDDGETDYLVYKIKPDLVLDFAEKDAGVFYLLQLNYCKGKNVWRRHETEGREIGRIVEMILLDYFSNPYALELSIKAYAILLLTDLLRSERHELVGGENISLPFLRKIYDAINIVNENYREELTAKECALKVDMSYTHFSRCFKAVIGKSFTKYLCEVRINSAEKELYMTDKSITEIAYGVGFNDVSYFISIYKKLRGKTPKRMRNGRTATSIPTA